MIRMLAATAALALLATGAEAQLSAPGGVMPSFNFQFVEPTLQAAGVQYQRISLNEGYSYLKITLNDTTFLAAPTACIQAMCAGFKLEANFNSPASVEKIMDFNNKVAAVKVIQQADGSSLPSMSRYLIGDYGYVRGSFIVNLQVFANLAKRFESELAAEAAAKISYEVSEAAPLARPVAPGTKILGDDFADGLNARQKLALISVNGAIEAVSWADPEMRGHLIDKTILSGGHDPALFNHFD